jgi:protein-S-isoprenylcysteine O-methyltransferase Ste14
MVLLQVGIGIWANSLWFVGLEVIAAALLWWGVISREERYLERKFGAGYLSYKERVRRWL